MNSKLLSLIGFSEKLARDTGQLLMRYWPGLKGGVEDKSSELNTKEKQDGSLVTAADIAADNLIRERLATTYPDDSVLTEEGDRIHGSSGRTWIVDPLDGTTSFSRCSEDFSVLIALVEAGRVLVGVAYFPARDCLLKGHFCGPSYVNDQPLVVSTNKTPEFVHFRIGEQDIPEWGSSKPLDSGEAQRQVASGQIDGVVLGVGRLQQWDLAPFSAIIAGAGGKVTDQEGRELVFGEEPFDCQTYVATSSAVHPTVLAWLAAESQ